MERRGRAHLLDAAISLGMLEDLVERIEGYRAFRTRDEALERHGGGGKRQAAELERGRQRGM